MDATEIRLLVPEGRTEKDLRRAAVAARWNSQGEVPANGSVPRRIEWETGDQSCQIVFVHDHVLAMAYVILIGDDVKEPLLYATRIGGCLPFEAVIERAELASSADELQWSCRALALVSPRHPDPRVVVVFSRALAHDDPAVRWTALLAHGYLAWPEFNALIDKLALTEADPHVTEALRLAVGSRP